MWSRIYSRWFVCSAKGSSGRKLEVKCMNVSSKSRRRDIKLKGKNEIMTLCVCKREAEWAVLASVWLWPTQTASEKAADSLPSWHARSASATCSLPRTQKLLPGAPVTESTAATGGRIQTFIHKKLWLHSLVITSRNMEIYTVMRHRWISCLLYIHFRHNTWSNYAHMHFLKILAINVLEYNGTYMESPYSQQGILCYKCHKGRTGQNNLHRESKLMLF